MVTKHLKAIQHQAERAITPFHIFDLSAKELAAYKEPHTKDHFCLMYISQGQMKMQVEDRRYDVGERSVCIIFPEQLSSKELLSPHLSGKLILFDEVLFCSDILKNELSIYNHNISVKLNCITLTEAEAQQIEMLLQHIEQLYADLTSIKKEQARFFIKIVLLKLVEFAHMHSDITLPTNENAKIYARFLDLLERNFKTERAVAWYAAQLRISTKKLNSITKKLAGLTAIETIHARIMNEIKQLLLLSKYSHKEIAFELGFNSPAALNKFVRAKLDETPTDLQNQLAQMYHT
ncbi:helix-turn-helix transcriptional regulator [Sphingobacterium oryzagri]|uniref:Helix-turn-helix transcriptional regulator n=1 Tax=Sphingobacterium oryzagri TaxID=3025669 RepID=A0ABY7WLT4_9SPHI|nr:helix-turn-helix transcriptional regulator [Sphingobacterium sp. KACC 22765]WDF70548.1 helix-turn-helix transcriptional regulator [Sphingobacterium sp. KACC 22765]